MKSATALVVIAVLVWLAAWFVTFEPDMTRWSESGRCFYVLATAWFFFAWYMFSPKKCGVK